MIDTELRPNDELPPLAPSGWRQPAAWSRRRVLAMVCAGGALSAAGPLNLISTSGDTEPFPGGGGSGHGTWTSAGSVTLLSATREARPDTLAHLHADAAPTGSPLANRTWNTLIRVQVEVHNGSDHAVLLSPGQFRLRLGKTGTTVSPYDVGRPAAAIEPAHTVRTWITYLAPAEEPDLRVEYAEPASASPQSFHLSALPVGGHGEHT